MIGQSPWCRRPFCNARILIITTKANYKTLQKTLHASSTKVYVIYRPDNHQYYQHESQASQWGFNYLLVWLAGIATTSSLTTQDQLFDIIYTFLVSTTFPVTLTPNHIRRHTNRTLDLPTGGRRRNGLRSFRPSKLCVTKSKKSCCSCAMVKWRHLWRCVTATPMRRCKQWTDLLSTD